MTVTIVRPLGVKCCEGRTRNHRKVGQIRHCEFRAWSPPGRAGRPRSATHLLLNLLRHLLCLLELLLIVREDRAPVLRSPVIALAVLGGGVVRPVEELDELAVADLCGVELNLHGLGVSRATGADLLVAGVLGRVLAPDVAHLGVEQALVRVVLAEDVLGAPEAARGACEVLWRDGGRHGANDPVVVCER